MVEVGFTAIVFVFAPVLHVYEIALPPAVKTVESPKHKLFLPIILKEGLTVLLIVLISLNVLTSPAKPVVDVIV